MVPVGLFVKRFLWHLCCHLDISRPERERRLGVSAVRLANFGSLFDNPSHPATAELRRKTVLLICLRTNLWASQLAHDPDEDWARDIDARLKAMGYRPSRDKEKNLAKKVGKRTWNKLRRLAEQDIEDTRGSQHPPDANAIASTIRHLIATNVLARGAEIDVDSLTNRIDQRPSLVRAGLHILTHEQIIETLTPQNGKERYQVAQVTADAGREIMQLRMLIEPALIREIRQDTAHQTWLLKELTHRLSAMEESAAKRRLDLFIDADVAFHMALSAQKAFVPVVLRNLLSVLNTVIPDVAVKRQLQVDAIRFHRAIVVAITKRTETGFHEAAEFMISHLQTASDQMFGPRDMKNAGARHTVH